MFSLLERLKENKISVWAADTELKVAFDKDNLDKGLIGEIKEYKQDLLKLFHANKVYSQQDFKDRKIFKVDGEKHELSFAQERLLFIERYEQGSDAYHIPHFVQLTEDVNFEALSAAFQHLVDRHAILRTTYKKDENQNYYQYLTDIDEVKNTFIKSLELLSMVDVVENGKQALSQVFDLSTDIPIRVHHYKAEGSEYLLVILHHIAFDGWSTDIFLSELGELYRAQCENRAAALPKLDVDYKDYALWQRSYLSDMRLTPLENYWSSQLDGMESLELPTDFPRPDSVEYAGSNYGFSFTEKDSTAIKQLAKRCETTPYAVLLSAFYVTLANLSGQKDLVIGTPSDNRNHQQIQSMIGFFVNSLVLREKIEGSESVEELIRRVNHMVTMAKMHQELPFEKLVEILDIPRDVSRHPIFQIMFTVQSFGGNQKKHGDLPFLPIENSIQEQLYSPAKFDLSLFIDDSQSVIQGNFNYALSLFEECTIERIADKYQQVLQFFINDSSRRVSEINLLSDIERTTLLVQWNQTASSFPHDKTISQLFEEQVERTPDSCALVFCGEELSYRELNCRANQLAAYIRRQYQSKYSEELKPDTKVGLCLDRSFEMIVAIMAVMKAGAAYVPLATDFPEDRLQFVAQDTEMFLLLTQELHQKKLVACLHEKASSPVIKAINDIGDFKQYSGDNIELDVSSNDLAYVIYTSGTSGKPKGVMLEHRSVINRLHWMINKYRINSDHRVLQKTPYTFDVSVWELLGPICTGAVIVIAEPEDHKEPAALIKLIATQQVSMLHFVPSMLGAFCQYLLSRSECLSDSVKLILCSGEALTSKHVVMFNQAVSKRSGNSVHLLNLYGPTETSIEVSYFEDAQQCSRPAPIGKPIDNVQLFILDMELQPVPVGVPGELFIGGEALARGYLNRDDLTKKSFIDNPLIDELGESFTSKKLYKTGDLVRWLPDGNIEYLGRNDFQVKIHGHRVELEEIEQHINSVSDVEESVVCALDCKGTKNLVAYIIATGNSELDEASLKEKIVENLSKTLPEYMIPSLFISIDAIPVNANGKLNRKALPKPDFSEQEKSSAETYISPKTELEIALCSLWQELFAIERVGIHDDFFKLGGNSILAIRMISLVNVEFDSDIAVKDVFLHKTPSQIVKKIESSKGEFKYKPFVLEDISALGEQESYPLTNVQQAYLYGRSSQFEMGNISTHVYTEFLFSHLNVEKLEYALNIMIARHPALRTVFSEDRQRLLSKEYIQQNPYKINNHYIVTPEGLESVRESLSHKAYDVSQFPLFSFEMTQCEYQTRLHMSVDALIMDAGSFAVFFKELIQLYNSEDITTSSLGELNLHFGHYVTQQQKVRSSDLFEQAKSYWQEKIGDYQFEAQLPFAVDPSTISEPKFSRIESVVPASIWKSIEAQAQRSQISPTSVVLYAYGLVLSKWTGQQSVCINLTLFNRLPFHPQVNNILGDFTVLELFQFERLANEGVQQGISRIHETLWQDIEHNLFDGIDVQRLIRKEFNLPQEQILSPYVLTSVLGQQASGEVFDGYIEQSYSISQTSQVYLDNKVYESEAGLVIEWDYVSQLFERQTIERIHEDFCSFIGSLAEADWQHLQGAVGLSTEDAYVVAKANSEARAEVTQTIVDICRESTVANKEKTAVIDANGKHSYEDIHNAALRIANYLSSLNNTPEPNSLVAVLSEKGANQLTSTLGIMTAGAAYLPLHVNWPIGRLNEVLTEGCVKHVLVSKAQFEHCICGSEIEEQYSWHIIENIVSDLSIPASAETLPSIQLDDIAYVIFTSGSTGKPKGVTIEHKGVVNTLHSVNERFQVNSSDKILALSELSFDLSVYDLFGVFAAGGCIVFPEQSKTKEPERWFELVQEHHITLWNTVPQLANLLYDCVENKKAQLESLRVVMMSGDWIPLTLPDQIKFHSPTATVMSLGGATEGSIWSIWYEINAVDPQWLSIPYGYAMPSQKMYVLNEFGEHCPVNVKGEIHIGGVGVAQNYWHDEQKTQASYVQHSQLGRIYKTGDLGCWNKNGYMEFHGRKDSQVKINGYRVELGEISSKIQELGGIDKVVSHVDDNQLAAYIVLNDNGSKKAAENESFDRKAFTLQQLATLQGLEKSYSLSHIKLDEKEYRLRKSYREFTGEPLNLSKDFLLERLKQGSAVAGSNTSLSLESLEKLFSPLCGLNLSDRVLPKYRYPSGGSSYPVQTYIRVNTPVPGLKSGYYYFQPIERYLASVEPTSSLFEPRKDAAVTLEFNIALEAIEPLYGENSTTLAVLELGHMLALLEHELKKLGLGSKLQLQQELSNQTGIFACLDIYENEASLDFASEFTANHIELLQKQGEDFIGESLELNVGAMDVRGRLSKTIQMIGNSEAIVAFKGGYTCNELVSSGYWTQRITESLYEQNIGSCALGYIPCEGVHYSIMLGRISDEQKLEAENQYQELDLEAYIKRYLASHLPVYMQPKHIVTLDELPLNANGKVDYKRLPKIESIEVQRDAPKSATEEKLCELWKTEIQLEALGTNENFFQVGGDSIVAIRLVAAAKTEGIVFSVGDLFTQQTVAKLAEFVADNKGSSQQSEETCYQAFSLISEKQKVSLEKYSDVVDAYPATQLQLGMLLESKREKGTYHDISSFKVNRKFDEQKFASIVECLIASHEILRTGFIENDECGYLGFVVENASPTIELISSKTSHHEIIANEHSEGFEFSEPGLCRFIISEVEESSFVLTVSFHHAILDGWSINSLMRECLSTYLRDEYIPSFDLLRSILCSLPKYGEYVALEQEAITNSEVNQFWENYISRYEPPVLGLIKSITGRGEEQPKYTSCNVSKGDGELLLAIANKLLVPIDCLFLGVYHKVLCQLQSTDELALGLVVNNRLEKEGGDRQLGLFLNTIPFIMSHQGQAYSEFLSRVADEKARLMAYKSMPYSKIRNYWKNDEDLYHCVFNYVHNEGGDESDGKGVVESIHDYEKTNLPLVFRVLRHSDGFELSIKADPNKVDSVLFDQLLPYINEHVQFLISGKLSEVLTISSADRENLAGWSKVEKQYANNLSLVDLFNQSVASYGNKTALITDGNNLSYSELNERATSLARGIRKNYFSLHGMEMPAGTFIGLYLERSSEMVISLLAILKAGGAYVSISTHYPEGRSRFIAEDTQAPIVLTQEDHLSSAKAIFSSAKIINVSDEAIYNELDETNAPQSNISPKDYAYVIYTSGTTGKPKGVIQTHENVQRLLASSQDHFNFSEKDTWVLFHEYTFDFSVWEIWGALAYGGGLVIPSRENVRDTSQFIQLCQKFDVSVLNQTPAAFYNFADVAVMEGHRFTKLRYVIFGGDKLNMAKLVPWWNSFGDKQPKLVNMYGITETTVHVTFKELNQGINQKASNIGIPLPDMQAFILDNKRQPVPVGTPGELYIGGAGLAPEYLNRAELSAERFISTGESDDLIKNTRLYKTGDVARWLPNGELEYFGRNDSQVKIRGHRIELGEIESAISMMPQVKEAVVIDCLNPTAKSDNSRFLCAYVVLREDEKGEIGDKEEKEANLELVKENISNQLPEYMLPAVYMIIDQVPLTINGKLARNALPVPSHKPESDYQAPENEVQQLLCECWQAVLGLEKISINDNFFQIGGDSILAIRVIAKAKSKGIRFSVNDLFSNPTIKQLQYCVISNQEDYEEVYQPFSLLSPEQKAALHKAYAGSEKALEDGFPAAQLQIGMLLESARGEGTYHDIFNYQVNFAYNAKNLERVVEKLVRKHEVLRMALVEDKHAAYLGAVFASGETNIYEENDLQTIDDIISNEQQKAFDFSKPGLFRFIVSDIQSGSFRLTFSFHHVLVDGWSVASLIAELVTELASEGTNESAEENPICYGEYVRNEQIALRNPQLLTFWKDYLQSAELPDFPLVNTQTLSDSTMEKQEYSLTTAESSAVLNIAKELEVPVDTVFLTLYHQVLCVMQSVNELSVGVVLNNRLEKEGGDSLTGLFLNTLPLRVQVYEKEIEGESESESKDKKSFSEYVQRVSREKTKILANKALPYSKIKASLKLEQDVYHCAFNYVHFHIASGLVGENGTGIYEQLKGYEKINIPLLINVVRDNENFHFALSSAKGMLVEGAMEQILAYMKKGISLLAAQGVMAKLSEFSELTELDNSNLKDWNKTDEAFPQGKTLHELFEAQVAKTPDAAALIFKGKTLTYQQLNERANQLAHYIRSKYHNLHGKSLPKDTYIPLYLKRGFDMVVSILAVLKAGGAYVPISPDYPQERIKHILDECQASLVLTQTGCGLESIVSGVEYLYADNLVDYQNLENCNLDAFSSTDSSTDSSADDLAYVIYTSGTTGKPKGVEITHGASATRNWYMAKKGNTEGNTYLFKTNYVFDVSVSDIFSHLMVGASLVICESSFDPKEIHYAIEQYSIDGAHFVPSQYSVLNQIEMEKHDVANLYFSGENLTRAQLEKINLEKTRAINYYGPTETGEATSHIITSVNDQGNIGKPFNGTTVYVLKESMKLAPVGAPGELYIGGAGLARSYLGQEQLTRERFIQWQGQRLYKTGDVVRWLPSGELMYLGRNDTQVKIHGNRVELAEIENNLCEHPVVKQAVAIDIKQGDSTYLAAYLVIEEGQALSVEALASHLSSRLPEYMLPAAYQEIASIPLTINGKLNRRALPEVDLVQQDQYRAPRNDIETKLCQIWQEALQLERVGIDDSFFKLGGNSILAIRIMAAAREALQVDLPIALIFEAKTIAGISQNLENAIVIPKSGVGMGSNDQSNDQKKKSQSKRIRI